MAKKEKGAMDSPDFIRATTGQKGERCKGLIPQISFGLRLWMPAGACPERSRRAGMTSFPRKRESRKTRHRNYAHASYNLYVTEHYATDRLRFYRDFHPG